jgi:hypothetical protein
MILMEEQERLKTYQQTRQAVLNGELKDGAAVEALMRGGWDLRAACAAVSVWQETTVVYSCQTTNLDRMARLLRIPDFSEPAGIPERCPGFGKELPADWSCPPCPVVEACYAALVRAKGGEDE